MVDNYDVIMLSHNTCNLTISAINHILNNSYYKPNIYVLDNDSRDNSVEMLTEYKNKNLIKNLIASKDNMGFGKGNNIIFNAINEHADITLFINSDTEASANFDRQAINLLLNNHHIGVIGCSSDNVGAINNPQRIKLLNNNGEYINSQGYIKKFSSSPLMELDRFSGFAFFIKSELYKTLNGFDENFKLFFEDDDLSIRVKEKGYKIYCCYQSFVRHYMSQSQKNIDSEKIFQESKQIFLKKHPKEWVIR